MKVMLFGPMRVTSHRAEVVGSGFGGRRPRQLLAILASEPGRAHPRDMLAERLWDGAPPAGYVSSLHAHVSQLRQRLAGIGEEGALITLNASYLLDPERVATDLDQARRSLAGADPEVVLDTVTLAARGLLPEDTGVSWADDLRASWEEDLVAAAGRAADRANHWGECLIASRLARAALDLSPYDEAAVRALMTALESQGRAADAIAAYHRLRESMESELGIAPQSATTAVFLRLLQGERLDASAMTLLIGLLHDAVRDPAGRRMLDDAAWSRLGRVMATAAG